VVDDEVDRDERVDLLRVAAEARHGVAHRGEVDEGGDSGEVLEEYASRTKRDLVGGLRPGVPARQRLDVGGLDRDPVLVAEQVLEQDPERPRQPLHIEPPLGEAGEAPEADFPTADPDRILDFEAVAAHAFILPPVARPIPRAQDTGQDG